ncbi:MAG: hypothetical protein ABSC72_08315 [Methylovirgula sp.]|jgi:hypothetical protein
MLRASASFIAGLALLLALVVAAFATESHFYPLSGSLARLDLPGAFAFPAQGAGSGGAFSEPGDHETIRVLTDDEIAFMARGTIDPDWDAPRDQSGNVDRASFAFAEALGSSLQWLASLWDLRLTGVLLWLAFLAFMLRPPRVRANARAEKSDGMHHANAPESAP